MKIEIGDYALSKNFKKLIGRLIKTACRYSKVCSRKMKVDISFVDEDTIRTLNREQRGIDKKTDVLSFPTLNLKPLQRFRIKDFKDDIEPDSGLLFLGDIIICENVARHNAEEYGHSFEREICYLVLHGFLHLLGYDHIKEEDQVIMRALEEAVLKKYKITRDAK